MNWIDDGALSVADTFDDSAGLSDTMIRYHLGSADVRPSEVQVTLIGTTRQCRDRFEVNEAKTVIGRQTEDGILIVHPGVSRAHCEIQCRDGEVRVVDLESSNGTLVNGAKVEQAILQDGDIIKLGPAIRLMVTIKKPVVAVTEIARPKPKPITDNSTVASNPTTTEGELARLKNERRQLAILFQLAMRYLRRQPGQDPTTILFDFLHQIVLFDVAFVATLDDWGNNQYRHHDEGRPLTDVECGQLLEGYEGNTTIDLKSNRTKELAALTVASIAHVAIAPSQVLVLASTKPAMYSGQSDFIALMGELQANANGVDTGEA